jgi:Icc-related predicted phosphoesterase
MAKQKERLRILAAGDIHGSSDIAEKLAEKAKKEDVDLVLLLGDLHGPLSESKGIIAPFKRAKKKVVFVPGNWDTSLESAAIRDLYDIKNIDGYYVTYKGVGIAGLGNPDFQLSIDEKRAFEKMKISFDKMKAQPLRKRILISHLHASGTSSELSGFPGSKALKQAVRYFEPDFLLQAHIHEAEGIEEKIGNTRVINVGRKGKIIEL